MITGIKFSYLQNEKLVAGGMFKPGIIVTDGYLWKYIWRGILELKCNILNTQLVDETERANVLFARLSQVSGFCVCCMADLVIRLLFKGRSCQWGFHSPGCLWRVAAWTSVSRREQGGLWCYQSTLRVPSSQCSPHHPQDFL